MYQNIFNNLVSSLKITIEGQRVSTEFKALAFNAVDQDFIHGTTCASPLGVNVDTKPGKGSIHLQI